MTLTAPAPLTYQVKGTVFGGQACSCAHGSAGACTGDPCTCGDPCPCEGADLYLGPRWRLVGDQLEAGTVEGVDVSQRIFLNLGQTAHERAHDWREVVLIDDGATPDQVRVLLALFQDRQGSDIAQPQHQPAQARAVYLVPMRYRVIQQHPTLCVTFSPDRSRLVHGTAAAPIQDWTFNGQMAVRDLLDNRSA